MAPSVLSVASETDRQAPSVLSVASETERRAAILQCPESQMHVVGMGWNRLESENELELVSEDPGHDPSRLLPFSGEFL